MENLSRVTTFLIFLFLPSFLLAAEPLEVVINEIAWMGNEGSFTNEWIELFNTTNTPINLDGWQIKAADGTPEINLKEELPAKGYFLLERTNENTLPTIEADLIYKGSLENEGEDLTLYDNSGNLIDSVPCFQGWFRGDNKTKQTMERKNPHFSGNEPENWQTSQNPGGTPKVINSILQEKLPEAEPSEVSSYFGGIVINEILPDPEGKPDNEGKFIELFNKNKEERDLTGWKITDVTGSRARAYTFPENTIIGPGGFLVFYREETEITLNNLDGDTLRLLGADGKILDEVSYEKAEKGKSYNLNDSGWFWSSVLTPGSKNIITEDGNLVEEDISKKETEKKLPTEELATISKQTPESISFPFLFLIASVVAVFSAALILILKKKLKRRLN